MTDAELISALESLRGTMMAVATGGPRIADVNDMFRVAYDEVAAALSRRGLQNPLPYGDLWDWHGRWSSDLPTYRSRRAFVSELFAPLLNRLQTGRAEPYEDTGWPRVDRTVGSLRDQLATAQSEEEFQAVGLLAREALISTAQAVFDPVRHPTQDGVAASATDAKRMLEAYIVVEVAGAGNEEARRHVRSALDLAVALQHRRTATFRDAALCVEATTAVVKHYCNSVRSKGPAELRRPNPPSRPFGSTVVAIRQKGT